MTSQKKFEDECFEAHKAYRIAHGVPELKRDKKASEYAQNWAEHMARTGMFGHSQTDYGENIYWSSRSDVTGFAVTKSWYDEIQFYDFSKNSGMHGKVTGHFTQVVWKASTHAGFGMATGKGGTYAVGTYSPAGNFGGEYGKNVFPKKSEPNLPQLPVADKNEDTVDGRSRPTPISNKPTSTSSETKDMAEPGKTIETVVEVIVEGGKFQKKTTVTTTTVTLTPEGGRRTGTSTSTSIQKLTDYSGKVGVLSKDIEKMSIDPNEEKKEHDGKNVMTKREEDAYSKELIEAINDYRKKHGADSVKKSSSLQETALKHAKNMLKDDNLSRLTHDPPLGQCFLMKMPRPSGKETADGWYEGKKEYDFNDPKFKNGSGNFTQMVWKDSKEIGVGIASNKAGLSYVVAFFKPVGNVSGQFAENVKK